MATSELCADIGSLSINHVGEQLCGDHLEIVPQEDESTVVVLADGLGSGVKASILSTLTSKIISTMLAAGLRLEDAVGTIAKTLPVCQERGVAYSTFTILRLVNNSRAEIIQYDNPKVILIRDGQNCEYPIVEYDVGGKHVLRSDVSLTKGDVFILMSDGVEHAGVGINMNFGWERPEIIDFAEPLCQAGFTAKTLTTILLDHVNELYGGKPGDDATICTVRIRERVPMNLMFGLPANRDDDRKMMALFLARQGKHIVCGGTTSGAVSRYLDKPLIPDLDYPDPTIPPIASIEGVDLVTEGVVTMNRVVEYAKNYLADNTSYEKWSSRKDGASRIARLLFEEATDINFFIGRAVNPAHQNPDLPINFNIKMQIVEDLAQSLTKMGKKVKVLYY